MPLITFAAEARGLMTNIELVEEARRLMRDAFKREGAEINTRFELEENWRDVEHFQTVWILRGWADKETDAV